jgi:hypothetical protein
VRFDYAQAFGLPALRAGGSGTVVNKASVIRKIITVLHEAVAASTEAARATSAAATDPDSKAENKYDTRNLEASYLARGQAFRVAETAEALGAFEAMPVRHFSLDEPIAAGALVCLRSVDGDLFYFIGPAAGGTVVDIDSQEVIVITASSPLGAKLMGRRVGDTFEINPGSRASLVGITAVE